MSDSSGNNGDPYQPPSHQQPPPYPPPQSSPYGQPSGESSSDQPPAPQQPQQPQQPFGQPQQPQYGQPQYGQPQYGYDQPAYGYAGDPNKRPGTVTAAAIVTFIVAGVSVLLFALFAGLALAAPDIIERAMREQGQSVDQQSLDELALGGVVFLILAAWSLIAVVLAGFAMKRSQGARIGLVVSAVIAGLLSLFVAIDTVGLTLVWAAPCLAVIICLFTGGAGDWYARQPGSAPGSQPPTHRGPVA